MQARADTGNGRALIFRALGDRTRLRIVEILLKGERCACKLPSLVGKAQPTVSLQLKKLVAAGVLSFRKEGAKSIYRVSNPNVAKLLEAAG
jgi:ArsR family transcriptional regulator